MTETGRILALDLGKKRIGLAISDELGITAQGLETLEREGRRSDIEVIRRLTVARGVRRILLGNPVHMSGESSPQSEYTQEFAQELERKTGLPVVLRDERLTSWEAEDRMRGTHVARADRRGTIDRISAVILLEDYLHSLSPALLPGDGFDEDEDEEAGQEPEGDWSQR